MTIDEIKELVRVVHDTGIAELEVQRGDNRVKIRGSAAKNPKPATSALPSGPINNPGPAVPASAPLATSPDSTPPPSTSQENAREEIIRSPIVGTYYDSPAPGAPPFVRVGERIEPKKVLCIIESMKLMNEIEAEIVGTLVAKHVENGRPVEYGESLFTIRPY